MSALEFRLPAPATPVADARLAGLFQALSVRVAESWWTVAGVRCSPGPGADWLPRLEGAADSFAGAALLHAVARSSRVLEATFQGFRVGEPQPWFVLRVRAGDRIVVETADEGALAVLRAWRENAAPVLPESGPADLRAPCIEEAGADLEAIRQLFREYADSLDFDLGFQDFEVELATLPGAYAPPLGRLWIARSAGEPAGCVAVRPLDGRTCEMKRLFVRAPHRGTGLGRRLAETSIAAARTLAYARMRLDTVEAMHPTRTLYAALGFREIAAHGHNPRPDARYFELDRSRGGAGRTDGLPGGSCDRIPHRARARTVALVPVRPAIVLGITAYRRPPPCPGHEF